MAINDGWESRRTMADLSYTVVTVDLVAGPLYTSTYAIAAFAYDSDAEAFAKNLAEVVSRDWGVAVQRNNDDFVTWTSF